MPRRGRPRLQPFLDAAGRLKQWPARAALQAQAIRLLAQHFDPGLLYTEAEINAILDRWHTFGDPALLRRLLYEGRYLRRTRDGSAYWMDEVGVVARGL